MYRRILVRLMLMLSIAMQPWQVASGDSESGKPFIVHEWGTFTSYQNNQGESMYGLQRGDEPLPNFVYLRNPLEAEPSHSLRGCRRNSYTCDWEPSSILEPVSTNRIAVNQRMETPVIYFYSDQPRKASIEVDFPRGIITEWYPRASFFRPAIGNVDAIAGGSMHWDIDIHTDHLQLPEVSENSIWLPSRIVSANDISAESDNERLIFYRGVGDFTTDFHILANTKSFTLQNRAIENLSAPVPMALYVKVDSQGGYVRRLPEIAPGAEYTVDYKDTSEQPTWPMEQYINTASELLVDGLVTSGLYRDEAVAMMNTWKHAYFHTPGERILYILPSEWTHSILPIRIEPRPDQLVRTLVGRVEVTSLPRQEAIYAQVSSSVIAHGFLPFIAELRGPFAEQLLQMLRVLNREKWTQAGGVITANMGEVKNIENYSKIEASLVSAIAALN